MNKETVIAIASLGRELGAKEVRIQSLHDDISKLLNEANRKDSECCKLRGDKLILQKEKEGLKDRLDRLLTYRIAMERRSVKSRNEITELKVKLEKRKK